MRLAQLAVPLSGVFALLGGLSVALGYKAKWRSWLLVAFLVPVTITMHNFWAVQEPMMALISQPEALSALRSKNLRKRFQ